MSLSESTIKKAAKIVEKGLVQQLDNETWIVKGSSEDYEVSVDKQHGFFCKKMNGTDICVGWKFHRDCKHIEAVRQFDKFRCPNDGEKMVEKAGTKYQCLKCGQEKIIEITPCFICKKIVNDGELIIVGSVFIHNFTCEKTLFNKVRQSMKKVDTNEIYGWDEPEIYLSEVSRISKVPLDVIEEMIDEYGDLKA